MHLHQGHRPSRPISALSSCTAAPTARRFLAFLVGLGDGPRVGHVTPLRPEGPGCYLGPLPFCHAEGPEPTRRASTWASTRRIPPDLGGHLQPYRCRPLASSRTRPASSR